MTRQQGAPKMLEAPAQAPSEAGSEATSASQATAPAGAADLPSTTATPAANDAPATPAPQPSPKAATLAQAGERQRIGGGTFVLYEPQRSTPALAAGLYFIGTDKEGNEKAPLWVCAPLRVLAKTRGAKSADWGRLLEWFDADGKPHRWAVPAELLAGDGLDVRRELMRTGLEISPNRAARDLLCMYLQSWQVDERARCVDRLGWLGGVFVLPDEAIGAEAETVVFQSASAVEPAFSEAGTLAGWRESVAALASGNTRMVFAISCAFAPPLADLCGEDSGGFHLRGKSSSGKSTALALAASVWGSPSTYPRLWRTTANGLEGLAGIHNDGLLILDELSQCDPREAGDAAYLLANGQGKTRATRAGMARSAARWRLLFLSAGEESLSAMMARAGKRTNAGQEVRLADIEADAGKGLGAFDTLHHLPTAAALSMAMKDAAAKHHGAPGLAFLRMLVQERAEMGNVCSGAVAQSVRAFVARNTSASTNGQAMRVARRFGLVAAAGELATEYGLTGWRKGEASASVAVCFAAWLDGFGGGDREGRSLLAQVRAFFELHGASRFQPVEAVSPAGDEWRIANRAGYSRTGEDGTREFLVLPEVFRRELCEGFDPKAAAQTLVSSGVLLPGKDGKASRSERLSGAGTARVYVVTGKVLEAEE